MKALLIATGYSPEMEPMVRYRPTPLLNIVDKPIIVHIIEFLTKLGITHYEIILCHLPHLIEEKLEQGLRWGISITYHLVKKPDFPFGMIRVLAEGWKDPLVLLGQGDTLPRLELKFFEGKPEVALFNTHGSQWSGWGLFSSDLLTSFPPEATLEQVPTLLKIQPKIIKTDPFISTRNLIDLSKSNKKFISYPTTSGIFPATAHEVEMGIWVSHAVSIRPGLQVNPPIFIGENCQIMENVVLGPNTVIENNCIIDKESTVLESVICQKSYVGEGLKVENSVVDRNFLANLSHETNLIIRDNFILSGINPPKFFVWTYNFLERGFALLLFLLLSPIYLLLYLQCDVEEQNMLKLPTSPHLWSWKTFKWKSFQARPGSQLNRFQDWFKRLPLLLSVVKGDVHLIGSIPRSCEDARKLPEDWQKLYFRSKVGLITLADLDHGPHPSLDDTYASEIYYAVHMSFFYDIQLFFRWMIKKMKQLFEKGTIHAS